MKHVNFQSTKHWHALSAADVLNALATAEYGLTDAEAQNRLKAYGENHLPLGKRKPAWLRFLQQFHNVLIYVLIGAAVITALMAHWIDTAVIAVVVIINAIIGFVQENSAEAAIDSIREMLAPKAAVIRDGVRKTVEGHSLVPGDIVLIEAGDKVPADIRILSGHGLTLQEAILTGESVPVEKHMEAAPLEAALGDRSCMLFSGTFVAAGQGKGVVVATGLNTEIGRISGLLSEVKVMKTPLVVQMENFGRWLTAIILLLAVLLLGYGYFRGTHEFRELFMMVIGLTVATIPEGLPTILTITLAIGVKIMARRNAIVRHLPAIETLGSVSVICTDKTGTLTRNEMQVSSVLTAAAHYTVEGEGYTPAGAVYLDGIKQHPYADPILHEIARAAALCNDAALHHHNEQWLVNGDPMEGALLAFAAKIDDSWLTDVNDYPRTDIIPFDARHRFMATLNHNRYKEAYILVKGAPERILTLCTNQRSQANSADSSTTEPLNTAYWTAQIEAIAAKGQRVLAFAVRKVAPTQTVLAFEDIEGTLTLLGFVGLIDPPRTEAITAVADCHAAGISVKMITGDHAKTAAAIASAIGLKNTTAVLTGKDLDTMTDDALKAAVLDCDVFARTSPEHKLRLVMALQAHGKTVAMTGDGVNDAPALKRADAGIAMGKKGSEAAKEASVIVLADDNFASIFAAVREGRTVYDNLKKVIVWTLPTNAGEALTIMVGLLLGMSLPITPIQILWINLVTDVTLGLALAVEPTEEQTMHRPPRLRNTPLLDGGLVWHIVLVSLLFLASVYGVYTYAIKSGYTIEHARTLSFNMIVVLEIFHLFFIRTLHGSSFSWNTLKGTRILWAVVVLIVAAQAAIAYVPYMQTIFATTPITMQDSLILFGIGAGLFAILEIEKQIRKRLFSG